MLRLALKVLLSGGGAPSWQLKSGSGLTATWDADYANNQYWHDNTAYSTIASFFTAFGATFTRASAASFVGSNKFIQTESSNDVPRLVYKPSDGTSLGLLQERHLARAPLPRSRIPPILAAVSATVPHSRQTTGHTSTG